MEYVLELLDDQPHPWPRWEIGLHSDDEPTLDQHLFVFERIGFDGTAGLARAACQYLNGTQWVGRSVTPIDLPGGVHLCYDCMEVSLQHKIRAATSER